MCYHSDWTTGRFLLVSKTECPMKTFCVDHTLYTFALSDVRGPGLACGQGHAWKWDELLLKPVSTKVCSLTSPSPLQPSQKCPGKGLLLPAGPWSEGSMETELQLIHGKEETCFYKQNKNTAQTVHLYCPVMKTQKGFVFNSLNLEAYLVIENN